MADNVRHILIIDDDITSLDLVSYVFEERGYQVDRCADGISAIEKISELNPDLVMVDLLMPEVNGVETVLKIRSMGFVDTPIIAFTAVDDSELHRDAMNAGCNEVLTKPCPAERLVRSIRRYLPQEENR